MSRHHLRLQDRLPVHSHAVQHAFSTPHPSCLQGNINTPGFVEALQQLHDCGLTTFIIGGASFGVLGTISPQFGTFDRLREFGIVTTNVTGSVPPELGGMRALEALMLQGQDHCTGLVL